MIDNSSAWRYDPDVPLIVPEVNADAIAGFTQEEHHRQSELLDRAARRGAEAAARHGQDQARRGRDLSVGLGRRQGRRWTSCSRRPRRSIARRDVEAKKFPKRIAFNVIPHIDVFMEDGYTKEEWKMVVETKKILDPKIKLTATCVRVPVFIGHSEAVNIEFEKPITADEARDILREAPGCLVIDKREHGGYITPLRGGRRGRDLHQPHPRGPDGRERPVAVGRVRQSAQGRGAQRRADRRSADQPQADQREEEGGVTVVADLVAWAKRGMPRSERSRRTAQCALPVLEFSRDCARTRCLRGRSTTAIRSPRRNRRRGSDSCRVRPACARAETSSGCRGC